MKKKTKVPKKEKKNIHLEVVLLDEVFQVFLEKVFQAIDILRNSAFCEDCRKEKNK